MKNVNLLPEWYLRQARERRALRIHVLLMVGLTLALALGHEAAGRYVRNLRETQRDLRVQAGAIGDPGPSIAKEQAELDRLHNIQLAYHELGTPIPMSAVLQQIQNNMNPGMALSQCLIDVKPEPVKGSGFVGDPKAPPKVHNVASLVVTGVAPVEAQVVQLIGKLAANPLFSAVSLSYSRTESLREYAVRRFEIHMEMDLDRLGTENAPPPRPATAARGVIDGGSHVE